MKSTNPQRPEIGNLPPGRWLNRLLCIAAAFVLLATLPCTASAQEKKQPKKKELPKIEDLMKDFPSVEKLLTEEPVDWIVLKSQRVVIVEPVSPRPNTLEKIEKRIEEAKQLPRPQTQKEREERLELTRKLPFVYIKLIGSKDPNAEKKIHYKRIEKILHHEDLLLMRIGMVQEEGNLPLSYELLFDLKRRNPGWPKLAKVENQQLFLEAKDHVKQKQNAAALVKLEELHRRDRGFDGLNDLFGRVVDDLVTKATTDNDFRRARHYLGRLFRREPQHAVYKKWEADLQKRAVALLQKAKAAETANDPGGATGYAVEAVKFWPNAPGLRAAYVNYQNRFPQLRVGVIDPAADPGGFPFRTLADDRVRLLTQTPLFEPAGLDQVVIYHSTVFDEWVPYDLGRRCVFKLHSKRPFWQAHPVVTASILADNIRERMNPRSPIYDERLLTYIRSVRVISGTEVEIRFSRVPPRMESLFRFPVYDLSRRKSDKNGSSVSTSDGNSAKPPLYTARFLLHRDDRLNGRRRRTYRRNVPEPEDVPRNLHHVAEVVETTFDSPLRAIQALKRGEIHVLAHVRPSDFKALQDDVDRVEVREYASPITHVLQFNPESQVFESRELRRAVAFALNRKFLLEKYALRTLEGGDSRLGQVVSAPYGKANYAYNDSVEPKQYDIVLALALNLTINRQYQRAHEAAVGGGMMAAMYQRGEKRGWLPKLRMLVTPGTVARQVAEECVKQWGRIGIRVEIIDPAEWKSGKPVQWDIAYRTIRMVDPMVDLWPFLTLENRARVASLKHLPDWLRQEVIQLDISRDWKHAVDTLYKLHRHLALQTQFVPLFEVNDYIAFRRNEVNALSEGVRPLMTYQGIERWSIKPEYPPNFP